MTTRKPLTQGWVATVVASALTVLLLAAAVTATAAASTPRTSPTLAPPTVEQAKLTAPDGSAYDYFGYAVAVSGDTAVVGAYFGDSATSTAGSAYVYTKTGSLWSLQATLTASDAAAYDYFGHSVAISGDTIVVGADYDDDRGPTSGSAYVFTRSGSTWTQQAKLTASDGAMYDYFGRSVAISGDTIVVGADYDDNPAGINAGSAYVFTRSGSVWTQQSKLIPFDADAYDYFGRSVAVHGGTVAVGADYDDDNGTESGSVYVFTGAGPSWTQEAKITAPDGLAYDYFGRSVSLYLGTLLVGAYGDDDGGANAGSAYVYTGGGSSWSLEAQLRASDRTVNDYFGFATALTTDTALIGAYSDDDRGADSGSAYLFTRSGSVWSEVAKLTASDAAPYDYFGYSVALHGERAIMGAYADDDRGTNSGSAYLFSDPVDAPPLTTILPSPATPNGINGWYITSATVGFSRNKPGTTYYQWDGTAPGGWLTYIGSVAVPSDTHTIYYFSADSSANTETVRSKLFKVDTVIPTNPTITSPSHTTGVSSTDPTVDVLLSGAADTPSGVDGFSISWSQGGPSAPDTVKDLEEYQTSFSSPSLSDGNWYLSVRTGDNAGNWTSAVPTSGPSGRLGPFVVFTGAGDTTPPNPIANLLATAGDARVSLTWTNPSADFAAVRILRSTVGYANSPGDTAGQTVIYEGTGTSYLDTGRTNGTTYHYTAFARDSSYNWSTRAVDSATPQAGAGPVTSSWLTCNSNKTLVNYGGSVKLSGRLYDPLGANISGPGRRVTLWRSSNYQGPTPSYKYAGDATFNPSTGNYEANASLVSNTAFRFEFAGDATYNPGKSRNLLVRSKARMSRPRTPRRPRAFTDFTCFGYFVPGQWGKTRVEFYRRIGGRWVLVGHRHGRNRKLSSRRSTWTLRTRLPHRGWWKIRTRHWDAGHAKTYSTHWRYFKVI